MSKSGYARIAGIRALADTVNARMEGETAPAATPPAAVPTPPTPAPTPTPQPKPEPVTGDDATDWKSVARKHEDRAKANKAAAEEAVTERAAAEQARQDADAARQAAEAKQSEFLDGLAKLLGVKSDDAPPDPTTLQREIAERDTELGDVKSRLESLTAEKDAALREKDVELAAWRAASRHGANVPALLDSRTFLRSLATMDPAGETFAVDLDEAVKAALVANPTLSATPTLADAAAAGIGSRGADAASIASPGRGRLAAFHRTGANK